MRKSVPPNGALPVSRTPFYSIALAGRLPFRSGKLFRKVSLLSAALGLMAVSTALAPPTYGASAERLDFPENADLELVGRAVEKVNKLKAVGAWQFIPGRYLEPVEIIFDLGSRTPSNQWPKRAAEGLGNDNDVGILSVPEDAIGGSTNVSRDGETIVGYLDNGADTSFHAFLWRETTGLLDLDTLEPADLDTQSFARDTNSDGTVVVGYSTTAGAGASHAFRWTQATGLVDLGTAAGVGVDSGGYDFTSRAYGVSGDGSVVVGQSSYPAPDEFSLAPTRAFRWTETGGFEDIAPFPNSIATAVTADGSLVVGRSQGRAFLWTEADGLQDLGTLPGDTYSTATGISDDGSIVVGISSTSSFDNNGVAGALTYIEADSHAFYWTEAGGMQDLTQLLTAGGVNMTGKALVAADGISPDGKWITAVTTRPDPEFPTLYVDKIPMAVSLTETLPPPSRLANLSTRGQVLTGDNVLIPGFVISGTANKKLLIRAVGPKLADFGVASPLGDPIMALKRTVGTASVDVASNDNWGDNANAADIVTTSATLGAFALDNGSTDAVLLVDLEPGQYTVVTEGVGAGTGVAIAELYDADAPSADSKLVNISTRGFVGTGESIMIPGFVVSSESSLRLLVRAVGPTLGSFGVSGTLSDPQLVILRDNGDNTSTEVAGNDNWGGPASTPDVAAAATAAGAFQLASGSKDAAVVVQLLPGIYTVQASGVGGATGVALVEVYALE